VSVDPTTADRLALTRETIEELADRRQEPDWLRAIRLEAFAAFERLPMPDQRTEGWRRTSLRGLPAFAGLSPLPSTPTPSTFVEDPLAEKAGAALFAFRNGMSLREFWSSEGPLSYLGLAVAGFPNLFIVQAPGSPSAATNFVAALEQHVEWIGDCIAYLRSHGYQNIEALADAQSEWIAHTTSLVAATVLVHPTCNSWYNGGNVPGKKRMYMGYTAGIPEYRRQCDEIAAAGYTGFKLG